MNIRFFKGILLVLVLLALCSFAESAHAAPPVGQPAPKLAVTQLDGQKFDLAAAKGKVVLVHFWATWCGPCRMEMPVLDAFYRAHRGEGLVMIAVSLDRNRARDDVEAMMRDFAFPAGMLGDASANEFGMPSAVPVTYAVDRAGVLRWNSMEAGHTPMNQEDLDRAILPLLAKH